MHQVNSEHLLGLSLSDKQALPQLKKQKKKNKTKQKKKTTNKQKNSFFSIHSKQETCSNINIIELHPYQIMYMYDNYACMQQEFLISFRISTYAPHAHSTTICMVTFTKLYPMKIKDLVSEESSYFSHYCTVILGPHYVSFKSIL